MAKLNKSQLIAEVADALEVPKSESKKFLEAFVQVTTTALSKGKERKVAISGFANFELKSRKARTGRNPATGEKIRIPAKKVLKITPLKAFKDAVVPAKK